jgi:RimJ/RimL family protein N-acetyltransferase
MPFPDELRTDRLSLRPLTEAVAENMFTRYSHDPRVCRFMNWMPHRSVEETIEWLRTRIADNQRGASVGYVILSRSSGELLGSIGGKIQDSLIQFGYCLAFDAWGHGFATEAARAFVAVAAEQPALWRIQAFCDVENRASAHVLEKCGLTFEGTLRRYLLMPNISDAPRDMLCYAKVRE